ncbi:P-loop containing nucleoside triphosphate hydrolase protein [Mycena alexandri]|uniref:P-loop containing nucleoside triphosphate hydrolase protein n=1 Tax=Mycena alexandri TaxID=1745969 RepID=A0AAD6SG60_9AGAR|nr:P-loop containing nucleoside triphosphate hydrolase protein [Mycena alexandri]
MSSPRFSSSDADSSPPSSSSMDNIAEHGVGLSSPSLSLARRRMLDLVNRLHNTGVQIDIDLPQIAVIGQQSAGKSSLIESISGITLPRAAGTCTRCPTECRLSRSDTPWKCVVELRFVTDKNGQTLGQPRTESFGDPILDKSKVEDRIRRAQRAILNPSKSARTFLEDDDEDATEVSFSTNYISLQISGPEIADLSFVDLPGLIASVSSRGGNERDIVMVESLVSSYICKPSCVILLTVACETDFENQGAHNLTKKHDPEGRRTIGVLTKPDRIPQGDEESWLPLIRNEQETLENNWYCVKQPSSQDLKQGMTWEEARAREHEFFSLTPPWSELDPMYQKYLRTSNLVDRLSSILSDLISKRLPQIQIELENTIQKTRDGLHHLPKPPSGDPIGEVAGLLHVFIGELDKILEGIPHDEGLLQIIRPAQERFRREIRSTAPDFRPFEDSSLRGRVPSLFADPVFLSNEDGCEYEDLRVAPAPIFINKVMDRALAARTRELPGHYPFVVQKSFIKEFTAKWAAPAQVLCRFVHSTLSQHVKALITLHFAQFGQGVLERNVMILVQDYMNQRAETTQALIMKLIALEESGPLTLNEHYLSDYQAKFLAHYRGAREQQQNPVLAQAIAAFNPEDGPGTDAYGAKPVTWPPGTPTSPQPTGIAQVLSALAAIGLNGIHAEDLVKLLPPDRLDPALTIMADVRAYFQVAYKRIADNVPAAIDYELVRGVGRELLPTLYGGLGINGPDGMRICRELAQESPSVAGKREELMKRLERLETATRELMRVGL